MNETAYTNKLRKRLQSEGAVVWKWHGSGMGINGVPDLFVAHADIGDFWMEVKVRRNKTSSSQQQRIGDLLRVGCPAFVIRGPDHAVETADGEVVGRLYWDDSLTVQLEALILENFHTEPPSYEDD